MTQTSRSQNIKKCKDQKQPETANEIILEADYCGEGEGGTDERSIIQFLGFDVLPKICNTVYSSPTL